MPSGSRLLDDFLGVSPSGSLSDAELEQQLQAPAHAGPQAPANSRPKTLQDFESMMPKGSDEPTDYTARVDTAIRAASHGVKTLAPLLAAISKHVDVNADPGRAEEIMGSVLKRVRDDALAFAKGLDVEPDESPAWLVSQISGHLMPVMVNALDRGNGSIADPAAPSPYLEPLLRMAEQAKEMRQPLFPRTPSSQWRLIQALSTATAAVMTEYQAFPYFHDDAPGISQIVSDFLTSRVIEGSLDDITARWDLTDEERAYLGVSLLKQSGDLLAQCWANNIHKALDTLKMMPKAEARAAMTSGYPLDHVFEDFEAIYQGIEISTFSALRSLAPSRENTDLQPSSPYARMGN